MHIRDDISDPPEPGFENNPTSEEFAIQSVPTPTPTMQVQVPTPVPIEEPMGSPVAMSNQIVQGSSPSQQQQFIRMTPGFPQDMAAAMASAIASQTGNTNMLLQQQQSQTQSSQPQVQGQPQPQWILPNGNAVSNTNENGSMGNPFMAMALTAGQMPMSNREQFLQAAFAQRQNARQKRNMSTEQAERRRERNRLLAKKTRDKKKNHMEALQEEVMELQRINALLKKVAKGNLDAEESEKLLAECDAVEKVPQTVWDACGVNKNEIAAEDLDMVKSIQKSQTAFCITDPSFEDNPIVFVSPDFLNLTGYTREQVVGRNCRFLQGEHTCPDKVNQIRQAMREGEDVGVTLINYKADGTPFWNRLFIAAVRDINDNVVNYMGVAVQVARPEPGDPEHDKELR